jgi:hypothetical protein
LKRTGSNRRDKARELPRATAAGIVAAMAMTGMRVVTTQLGLVEEAPPEAVMKKKASPLLRAIPKRHRRAFVELAHWTYGAVGGVAFGVVPPNIRRHTWAGPVYGVLTWTLYEAGIAPALGLEQARHSRIAERFALALDHILYGEIVAGSRLTPTA